MSDQSFNNTLTSDIISFEQNWAQYVMDMYCVFIPDSTVLYPLENDKSLVQLQESLENVITSSLTKPAVSDFINAIA